MITKTVLPYIFSGVILIMITTGCNAKDKNPAELKNLREQMVTSQIERRGVTDKKVLQAMLKVERHRFVSGNHIKHAYEDRPLPIGEGQTISQPYIVALMTEVLELDSSKRVLEIGTGSGYQAAVLAEICDSVYTIEIIEVLGKRADKALKECGYSNVAVKIGDGYKGWKEHAPFDAIIVTCAPSKVPQPLVDQLAEGGKLVIPVDVDFGQDLILLTKEKGKVKRKSVIPVRFVPMTKEDGTEY